MQKKNHVFSGFNLSCIDPSWQPILHHACLQLDADYLHQLRQDRDWLPGPQQIFNAFSLPLDQVRYILFGESPYPRPDSANGYAFWDAAVTALWSDTGFTTRVNRATSLRNLLKMLFVAAELLDPSDTSQAAIARVDKTALVQTNQAFFANWQRQGVLLLNASLVLRTDKKNQDARLWLPFVNALLTQLAACKPNIRLILLGKIAATIQRLSISQAFEQVIAEHPYNLSIITNLTLQRLVKPWRLLYH